MRGQFDCWSGIQSERLFAVSRSGRHRQSLQIKGERQIFVSAHCPSEASMGFILERMLYRTEAGVVVERLRRVKDPNSFFGDRFRQVFPCRGEEVVRKVEGFWFGLNDEFEASELGLRIQTGPRKAEADWLGSRTNDSKVATRHTSGVESRQQASIDVIASRRDVKRVEQFLLMELHLKSIKDQQSVTYPNNLFYRPLRQKYSPRNSSPLLSPPPPFQSTFNQSFNLLPDCLPPPSLFSHNYVKLLSSRINHLENRFQ